MESVRDKLAIEYESMLAHFHQPPPQNERKHTQKHEKRIEFTLKFCCKSQILH